MYLLIYLYCVSREGGAVGKDAESPQSCTQCISVLSHCLE